MSFVVPPDDSVFSHFANSNSVFIAGITFGAASTDGWDALGVDMEFVDETLGLIDAMFTNPSVIRDSVLTYMFNAGKSAFAGYEDSGHTVDELTKTYALLLSMIVSIDNRADVENIVFSIEVLGYATVRDLLIANIDLHVIANGARNDVDISLLMSVTNS